jgi:DNA transformation protein and related proteins
MQRIIRRMSPPPTKSPAKDEFARFCCELLAASHPALAGCISRRMFGGWGISADGLTFAIIAFDQLYLKADEQTRARFVAAGCAPFEYEARGKTMQLRYYVAPPDAMESAAFMREWAGMAFEAALRAANSKPAKKSAPKVAKAAPSRPASAETGKDSKRH